jgi:hypothetical protein
MDWEAMEKHADEHVTMLRRLEAKMHTRRSLNESWCGHLNVTSLLCLPTRDRWVASCNDCFEDSSETHPSSDYSYSVPAKDVLDRDGLIDWLDHLTEKEWFIPGFDSFLDAAAFARAVHRRGAVAPVRENLRVVKWPSANTKEDDD